MDDAKLPNERLRHQRLMCGWTLQDVADKLYELCKQERRKSGISYDTVGRWERGESIPFPHYQRQLCKIFGKSAIDLGFMESQEEPQSSHAARSSLTSSSWRASSSPSNSMIVDDIPSDHLTRNQAFDMLCKTEDTVPAQKQLGAWLAMGAGDLAQLFDEGWSVEDILGALQFVLRGVKAMHKFSRRQLFQLGAAAVISGIPIPEGRHVSTEDRTQLCSALGENIAAGWQMFHTAGNAQVLAVGQAQLILLQQASSYLYPSVRPLYYSGVYNLIGAALHFQGHYHEAYQKHERAYLAALEGADVLSMAQSRTWQANGLREQKRHSEALQTIEAALRIISQQNDTASIRLRAHLLATGAENAALLSEMELVYKHLDASKALLEQLPLTSTEEFDHASWHQYAGTCALILKHYDYAIEELQQSIDTLPPQWIVRHATALMPLAIAYARRRERDKCLETTKKAAQMVMAKDAPGLNWQFAEYLDQEVLNSFPGDSQISTFVTDTRQRLLATSATGSVN